MSSPTGSPVADWTSIGGSPCSSASGADLATAAKTAFTSGLNVVALVGATAFLACALVARLALREAPAKEAAPNEKLTKPV